MDSFFFFVLACGIYAQNLSASFIDTIYMYIYTYVQRADRRPANMKRMFLMLPTRKEVPELISVLLRTK
jgi:hypothetical protein